MKRLAIIGSGIAGLGAAYFLHPHFDLTVFEQNDYVGGHSNTIIVDESGVSIPIDTGFMVFNLITYPNLVRLFETLGVQYKATDMSFSVQHRPANLEWCGSGYNQLFGQRRNLFRPDYWQFLMDLNRFNKTAPKKLDTEGFAQVTVQEFVRQEKYSQEFLDWYLIPMGSALWSTSAENILNFPMQTLIRFFYNHGFLGMDTHFQWYTVDGGSKNYVDLLTQPFASRIQVNQPVKHIYQHENHASVMFSDGRSESFDKVILACHADQALQMLDNPDPEQTRLLSPFTYEDNTAVLHSDPSVMPKHKRCWASWNYDIGKGKQDIPRSSTHYWMNNLQGVSQNRPYFVSINPNQSIDPMLIHQTIQYEHPLFSLAAINAQAQLPLLNQRSPEQSVYFCGSYFNYGFHEDAFTSALHLARVIRGEAIWTQ
ncbi:MAG: FAD-dependent oxidoreductase [Cyanobacteria bacterium]|nr:FAD-dependent oxidoreductase [Cyanobacteriota bacterium]